MKKKLLNFYVFIFACTLMCFPLNAQSGLDFDGSDDLVQTSYAGVLGTSSRTFEAWIYLNSAPTSNMAIMDYGGSTAGARNTFLVSSTGLLRFISGGTNANLPASANAIPVGQWTHVAFVLDNGTGYLYVDGTQVSTGNLSGVNTPSGNENLMIGQRVSGGNTPFAGIIDEVRVWNVARTQTEIQNNMNAEICDVSSNNLTAYYKLNDGIADGNNVSVVSVEDSSTNSNNGVLNNFALTGSTSNFVGGATIAPSINSTIILTNNDTTLSVAESGATYQWLDCANGNAIITGETNQDFMPTTSGSYAVEVTANGCTLMSTCFDFMLPCTSSIITSYPFIETFEDDSSSLGCWTQINEVGSSNWVVNEGATSGTIATAYNGLKNISFVSLSGVGDPITKYVSPVFDLSSINNPELNFYYAQEDYQGDINTLKVYYRISDQDAWVELTHLNTAANTWTQETIPLPNPTSTYQIAFEGINNFGYSNVIDDVSIENNLSVEAEGLVEVSLYPNPATSNIHINANQQIDTIEVFNVLGKKVGSYTVAKEKNSIDVQFLSMGMYFVKVTIDNHIKTFRMLKK